MSGKTNGRKDTMATSDAVLNHARARRIVQPTILKKLAYKLTTIPVESHKLLNVDERYQRVKIPYEINKLIHVLRSNGFIPDPISLAKRTDGSLWVVDGQERMWAHFECNQPINAIVFDVTTFEQERDLYNVLNNHVVPDSDSKVWSASGLGPDHIRGSCAREGSPIHGRVNFGRGADGRGRSFSAATLARSCVAMLYWNVSSASSGKIEDVLGRMNAAMENSGASNRLSLFYRLVSEIFPPHSKMKYLIGIGLGRVAGSRFRRNPAAYPSAVVVARLRKVKWEILVPSFSAKYLPVVMERVERCWPEPMITVTQAPASQGIRISA